AVIVRGAVLFMNGVMPGMVRRRKGSVIHVASLCGTWRMDNMTGYAIAKGAQIRLSEHAAAEAKEHGVSGFAIEPGTVFTDMAEATLASPDAQRWHPEFVAYLERLKATGDAAQGLARCAARCVELASGRYAALSGRFLLPDDNLEKLLH